MPDEVLRDDPAEWGLSSPYDHIMAMRRQARAVLRARRAAMRAVCASAGRRPSLRRLPDDEEWHLRIRILPDTRTPIARKIGDPRPGRSALELFYERTPQ